MTKVERRIDAGRLAVIALLGAAALVVGLGMSAEADEIHVAPGGADTAAGSAAAPLATIQQAIDRAGPGDVVELAPGRYVQDFRTARDGEQGRPIVVRGPRDAIVVGGGRERVVEVNHDYVELRGFTLDGHHDGGSEKSSYRDKLLYVIGRAPGHGVTGLKVIDVAFRDAGGECVRMRYQARRNEIAQSSFQRCGRYDFVFKDGGKNGEAIYIGTGPEQLGKWGAPDAAVDHSDGNWIHHNVFDTDANECVDIKEGSSGNIVEHNTCTGQRDVESAGLGSRGSGNVFRYNTVFENAGAGIRVGGDGDADGIDNDIYENIFRANGKGAVRALRAPQGKVCGNTSTDDIGGAATGMFGKELFPLVDCADPLATAAGRAAAAEKQIAEKTAGAIEEDGPPLACPAAGEQCVVGRIEGDERGRIKIFDASDVLLRGKHLRLLAATDEKGAPVDLAALAGRTVLVTFADIEKKVLRKAVLVRRVDD